MQATRLLLSLALCAAASGLTAEKPELGSRPIVARTRVTEIGPLMAGRPKPVVEEKITFRTKLSAFLFTELKGNLITWICWSYAIATFAYSIYVYCGSCPMTKIKQYVPAFFALAVLGRVRPDPAPPD